MESVALQICLSQPTAHSVVWQHNSLAEARYNLTAREQKVLLYVISMIEADDDELKLYKIRVEDFANLVGLNKDDLYDQLHDIVLQLKSKRVLIRNHFERDERAPKNLITSWLQDIVYSENRDGYIGVSISVRLKPYLLQVKREFFRYELTYAIELKSSYALRMYQWAKRWQFAGKRLIGVEELRIVLGAEDINEKGKVTKRLFPKYGDFHIWAIKPAVKEINLMTDLKISYVEQKTPGTKRVEALLFRIAPNARCDQLLAPIPGSAGKVSSEQPELFGQQDESEKYLEEVQGRFKLSAPQIKGVRSIVAARGMGYLKEKDAVVMRMRPDNAARALLAALRDDWQPPVEIKKRPGLKNQTADAVVNNISPEEAREAARALREFRTSLA